MTMSAAVGAAQPPAATLQQRPSASRGVQAARPFRPAVKRQCASWEASLQGQPLRVARPQTRCAAATAGAAAAG
jgi:hypothetical protein